MRPVRGEKERARKRGGVTPFGDALGAYLRASGLDAKLRDAAVFGAWRDAVGPELSQRARAVRMRDGELAVAVRSSALLQELTSFTGEGYRRAANQKLGAERIRRVVFQIER